MEEGFAPKKYCPCNAVIMMWAKKSCTDADFFWANVQTAGLPEVQTFAHSEQDNSFAKEYRMSILFLFLIPD
jgi:hypothetical protein